MTLRNSTTPEEWSLNLVLERDWAFAAQPQPAPNGRSTQGKYGQGSPCSDRRRDPYRGAHDHFQAEERPRLCEARLEYAISFLLELE